jgi:hypothetical protein
MFIYLDTETTGNGPDDRLCQIAFKPENGPAVCEIFKPGKPIFIRKVVSRNRFGITMEKETTA